VPDVRVVGVAVLRAAPSGRRLLAARRRAPDGRAGGWELPGGKCEPAETLAAAAVREVREELGCEVRVTGRLPGAAPIRPGLTLEVVTAELVEGEPRALEHAELRWLDATELDSVGWLPADVPFLTALAAHLAPDVGSEP
jgi:8-oxo-dGTP diphosphatase